MTRKISACALGALTAAMLVPTAVASADQTDQEFTHFLQSHGVSLGSTDQAVNMARVMCQDLNSGYSQKDEIDQLTGSQRLNESQAELFVGAATADYCPGKHSSTRTAGK